MIEEEKVISKKKKDRWRKPEIIFELPFERTAAGNYGGGDDYVTYQFSES